MDSFKNKYGKYFAWGITILAVAIIAILFYFGMDKLGALFKAIASFLTILSPFIWGLIISYLLAPSMVYYEKKLFDPMLAAIQKRHPKFKYRPKLSRVLALILAELLLLALLTALVYLIAPQLYESIATIVENSADYFSSAYDWLEGLLRKNPEIEKYATGVFGNLADTISKWSKETLLPGMENVVVSITSGVYGILKALYNIIIGIVVSVYILYNKEGFKSHCKKILYSIFSKKNANKIGNVVRFTDAVFMKYLIGTIIDAAIIGVACYLGCLIFKIPYPLLVAVIVGVTNVIPFFGPFIGAIPCGLLILLVDPIKCLIFAIFILILQQMDGNVIKPKIFGGSIGINGFWVIFSIIVFGGLFGFWGMFLGIPIFAVLYEGISRLINMALERKSLPTDPNEYTDMKYIDLETGELCTQQESAAEKPPEPEKKDKPDRKKKKQ